MRIIRFVTGSSFVPCTCLAKVTSHFVQLVQRVQLVQKPSHLNFVRVYPSFSLGNYLFICGLLAIASFTKATTKYEPHWNSLDTRPLPPWYDQAKVGIFLHWGVFSVPGYVSEWFWWYWVGQGDPKNKLPAEYMKQNYPPGFTYPAFAKDFTCELFDPEAWARIFEESGAR